MRIQVFTAAAALHHQIYSISCTLRTSIKIRTEIKFEACFEILRDAYLVGSPPRSRSPSPKKRVRVWYPDVARVRSETNQHVKDLIDNDLDKLELEKEISAGFWEVSERVESIEEGLNDNNKISGLLLTHPHSRTQNFSTHLITFYHSFSSSRL